ncbi:MAG: nucleoside-diphosphate kinase [Patescibacteria group bacterium]|nr:nucleoside-diphosphate kinase [Patescibacteria group bacterium]
MEKKMKIVDGKLRFWYGDIQPRIDCQELCDLTIGLCILKPDITYLKLKDTITDILSEKLSICLEKKFTFNEKLIFDMYPGFHELKWANDLKKYLLSDVSHALILTGPDVINELNEIKNHVRHLYKHTEGNIINLMHTSDTTEDTLRESLLLFKKESIINAIKAKI